MAVEQGVRLDDYLNDKLQRQADLDVLDDLIEKVREQQVLFKQQLLQAQSDHERSKGKLGGQNQELASRVEAFRKRQTDMDKKLQALTRSEVSDEAVHKFQNIMVKLGELEIAENYVGFLSRVEALVEETSKSFKKSPLAALRPYLELQEMVEKARKARFGTEEAAPHFNDYVSEKVDSLWKNLRDAYSQSLSDVLHKIGWPKKGVHIEESLEAEWTRSVDSLLELQKPNLAARSSEPKPLVLLPYEIMINPLAARFKYHFSGDRPTNRLDKPEYFLSHIVELLNDYDGFFAYYFQPVLQRHFKRTSMALNAVYIDSTSALITAVLPMLRDKLVATLPEISKQPQLLSHLVRELLSFDSGLRDDWNYGGGSTDVWKGITGEILDDGWFVRWLEVEKDFALKRYHNIIDSQDSGEIDFESTDPGITKPTKAALRVNDLLETISDRYRPLSSFQQKLKFVVDIQLAIFDRYHERLNEALDAFITLSNPITRKVQGFSREDASAAQGIPGIERLCRIYGSAEYLVRKMSDWSNDVFFLELWDELQFRSGEQSAMEKLEISIQDVNKKSAEEGALFDEVCGHYEKLRLRTERLLCEQAFTGVREALRPYNRVNPWTALENDTSITPDLDAALQILAQELEFLRRCLSSASLRKISRSILHDFQNWIWDHIVQRNNFSTAGVEQLQRDLTAIWNILDTACGRGFGQAGSKRLDEALQLMALPLSSEEISLKEVEQRIFKSNEEARVVMEELGLYLLTEADARMLIQKRVELSS